MVIVCNGFPIVEIIVFMKLWFPAFLSGKWQSCAQPLKMRLAAYQSTQSAWWITNVCSTNFFWRLSFLSGEMFHPSLWSLRPGSTNSEWWLCCRAPQQHFFFWTASVALEGRKVSDLINKSSSCERSGAPDACVRVRVCVGGSERGREVLGETWWGMKSGVGDAGEGGSALLGLC